MAKKKTLVKRKEVTLLLEFPVEYQGELVEKLVLRRPKVKHLKRMLTAQHGGDDNLEGTLVLLADISGREKEFWDELDGEDFMEVQKIVANFLGVPPESLTSPLSKPM